MANRFVDFSATNDGDGTTAAQAGSPGGVGAWKTIVGKTVTGHTVWIRRTATVLSLSAHFDFGDAPHIGWPISGDVNYSTRPASGSSNGWDSDSATYAEIDNSVVVNGGMAAGAAFVSSALVTLHRLKLRHTQTTNAGSLQAFAPAGGEVRYCYIQTDVQGNASFRTIQPGSTGFKCYDTIFQACDQAVNMDDTNIGVNANYFYDCTFKKAAPHVPSSYNVKTCGNFYSRCTFQNLTTGGSSACLKTSVSPIGVGMPGPAFVGCSFDNSLATSYTKAAMEIDGKALFRSCQVNGTGFRVTAAAYPPMHFSRYTQTLAMSTDVSFQVATPGIVKVDNAAFVNGNLYDLAIGDGVTLLMTAGTFKNLTTPIRYDGCRYYVYLRDESGASGNWRMLGNTGDATKSNVARTGGEVFSILCTKQDTTPAYVPLELGGWPGFEEIVVPLSPGTNTVTVYCAYKNFESDPPTCDDLWFEFDYLDAGTGPTRSVTSSKSQAGLAADASTWTGDTVTGVKLVQSVVVTQGQLVGIRIYHGKAHAASGGLFGQVYIDPKVVVS